MTTITPTAAVVVDLRTLNVSVSSLSTQVQIQTNTPGVVVGIPGPRGNTGSTGATGLVKVTHGSNPNIARPTAPLVYWVGTVQPVNAAPDDLLMLR